MIRTGRGTLLHVTLALVVMWSSPLAGRTDGTYTAKEILAEVRAFFGETNEGMAKVVEKVFADQGEPNAYIAGEEVSGAIGIGATYGSGELKLKRGGARKIFWQGPSVGFDLGGNASKVFVLVYRLPSVDALFQRFPGVDGSLYYVGGVGVNYQRSGDIVLAPIRLGVGLRAGASVSYMHYTRKKSLIPF